jgi:DNA repair exonuclease SbcCD nuclease subunit
MQEKKTTLSSTKQSIPKTTLSEITVNIRKDEDLVVAVISDVHLGHNRVKSSKIISVLEHNFSPKRMEGLDVIIISGDLFEKRLAHDSDDAFLITRWMERFLKSAAKYSVAIRILEGTPSHDNRQSRWMVHYNEMIESNADVKYYENIVIGELIPGGPTVLYIQDEMNHDANRTWKQVQGLMREKGIDQVDFAVMHGMFTYQEPVRSISSHTEERYESIVKELIIIGHNHQHTVSGKIRVPSSIERLRYNEEDDKGHLQFCYSKEDGVYDEYFIINEDSTIFTTLDVAGKSLNQVIAILKKLNGSPDGSHYRLKLSRTDEAYTALPRIINEFPHFDISTKVIDDTADIDADESDIMADNVTLTSIRSDNLRELLTPWLEDIPPEVMTHINKVLEAC